MNCNCHVTEASGPTLASTCGASILLFMGILENFIRRQCDLEDPCSRPMSRKAISSSYDYVVIGGGSGGSTVAGRLSEDKEFSVLLIEAGMDEPAWTRVPSFFINYLHSDIDWQYDTEKEDQACLNKEGQKCYWGRGKVLGGTSVMNGMMYMRGSPKDYDNWEKMGNKGWSYKDVFPYFLKSENNRQVKEMDEGYHATGGPLSVTQFKYKPPLVFDFLKAAKELGYDTMDLNGKNHTGFANAQTTTENGSRFSVARAFIRPVKSRRNLHITLKSTATRIIFGPLKKAVGVEFIRQGTLHRVRVKKGVIVSGGAVNSPQILLNSGIGPKEDLEAVGVPVVHDLPGVGKNLHNHVSYGVQFTINETETNNLNWDTVKQYLRDRDGPMSGAGIGGLTGKINTKYANPKDDQPDLQLFFQGYLARCSKTGAVNEVTSPRRAIGIFPTVLHPKSKGYLKLRDNDPLSKPVIQPKYLQHPDDVGALVEGIKFAIKLAATSSLKQYDFQLVTKPVKNCEHLKFGSDSYWECAIKHETMTENHQAGSCKMGPPSDPLAVVDNKLRVKGVRGVWVADTSIMPDVTSGNTNAPAIMIGERAADFIKNSRN